MSGPLRDLLHAWRGSETEAGIPGRLAADADVGHRRQRHHLQFRQRPQPAADAVRRSHRSTGHDASDPRFEIRSPTGVTPRSPTPTSSTSARSSSVEGMARLLPSQLRAERRRLERRARARRISFARAVPDARHRADDGAPFRPRRGRGAGPGVRRDADSWAVAAAIRIPIRRSSARPSWSTIARGR